MENLEPNAVVVVDKRKNTDDAEYDQNMQVQNSYKIRNRSHQEEIIDLIRQYNDDSPVSPGWDRTAESMLTEWKAHNDGYFLAPLAKAFLNREISENCRHVDFNNKDENLGYWDYYSK